MSRIQLYPLDRSHPRKLLISANYESDLLKMQSFMSAFNISGSDVIGNEAKIRTYFSQKNDRFGQGSRTASYPAKSQKTL